LGTIDDDIFSGGDVTWNADWLAVGTKGVWVSSDVTEPVAPSLVLLLLLLLLLVCCRLLFDAAFPSENRKRYKWIL
jgi:hypothetical protein